MNRKRWVLVVLLLGLAALLLFQHQQLLRLGSENENLRLRLNQTQVPIPQAKSDEVRPEKLQRLRLAEHDVLRLRGEVAQLRTELQAALAAADQGRQSKAATSQSITGFQPFQATVQTDVPNGQMLAMGGWPGHAGNRILLLSTPRIAGERSDQIEIQIRAIEGTDAFLAKFGLYGTGTAGDAGQFQQVLSAAQTIAIMKALSEAPGRNDDEPDNFTRSLYVGSVTAANGQVASLPKPVVIEYDSWSMGGGFARPQPGENLRTMGPDLGPYAGPPFVVLPVISADNTTVNLRFHGTIFKRTLQTP